MAGHEAQSYKDPGTPEEQSRRTFMTNATLAVGGVITLVLGIPLAGSLIPESLVNPKMSAGGVWADLGADDIKKLQAGSNQPIKITFNFQYADGYMPPAEEDKYVWGVKLSPQMMSSFQTQRPDLFTPTGKTTYPPFDQQMGFAIFSPICPHLGCQFAWDSGANKFICPCHGSQFDLIGERVAGPAQRGLDPLPFRDQAGKAQVTWIQYKAQQPDRVIVSYS